MIDLTPTISLDQLIEAGAELVLLERDDLERRVAITDLIASAIFTTRGSTGSYSLASEDAGALLAQRVADVQLRLERARA